MRRWWLLGVLAGCAHSLPARSGNLLLDCEPKDAEVFVEGFRFGHCVDFSVHGFKLGQGLKQLQVRKHGFLTYEAAIDVSGTRATLTVALQPLAQERASP